MKPISQLEKDLKRLENEIKAFPKHAAVTVANYTHGAFRNGKWDGVSWKARKSKDSSDRKNPDQNRRLMTKTRTLERSVNTDVNGNTIVVSTNVKYAQIHNEGGVISHPGGTAYLPFNQRFTARKAKGKIASFKGNQMIFIKKSQMSKFPQAKLTKAHKIPIPKRQFMGYSNELILQLKSQLDNIIKLIP